MNLQYAKNPRWVNAEHTMIDLEIKWDAINEELPFTASPNDTEAHGRAIFEAAATGQFGAVSDYVAPELDPQVVLDAVQAEAKQRLADTDWSQVADVAAVLTNKAAFDTYRAAVRDLFFNPVAEPVWPERPEAVWSQA